MNDLTEAGWIELDTWAGSGSTKVASVVPRGFAAYVRIFHSVPGTSGPRKWSDVAEATGRTMHPLAQWKRISRGGDAVDRWDSPPEGVPSPELLTRLVSTLGAVTSDPSLCFFAIWDGWGQLHSSSFVSFRFPGQPTDVATPVEQFIAEREEEARRYPRFECDPATGRPYLLGTGPLEVVLEISDGTFFERPGIPVSMWWPSDHSWFVASEIDFDSTVVGGSTDLRDAIVGDPGLEALEVQPDGVLSENGDTINPLS
jgi:hypothetical protein